MDIGDYVSIDKIRDKKLYNPTNKEEIEFETLYSKLNSNQLLYVVFFRRWGWVFCKAGALELSKTFAKVNKEYPNRLRFVGVGVEELGYDEFLKEGYFQSDLYVNRGKTIYKAMNFAKPGCLSCWGFCKKDVFKRLKNINENFAEKKLKTDVAVKSDQFQMGGSIMITPTGNVIFQHQDAYYGDHAKEDVILEIINNYFGNENANNEGSREVDEDEKLSGR
jgi:hypothetical protein